MLRILACLPLGVLIYRYRLLDLKGTLAATAIAITIVLAAGFSWLGLLLLFLILGHISTKYKYSYKAALEVAEGDHGRRSISNVLANGLVATLVSLPWYLNTRGYFPVNLEVPIVAAYIAVIATVTGDTLSSEIGILSNHEPVLITSFQRVPPGTQGGISLLGEAVGLLGALTIGLAAWFLGMAGLKVAILSAVVGGAVGFNFDSLLGAVFERRQMLGNAGVNFLSTIAGGLVGFRLALAL